MTTIVREEKPVNVLNVATALASGALTSDAIAEMYGRLDASDFDNGLANFLDGRGLPFSVTANREPVDVLGLLECVDTGKIGLDTVVDAVKNLPVSDLNTAIVHLLDTDERDERNDEEHDECCA